MGMLMSFRAGDAERIGKAFALHQFSVLRDPAVVLAEADFSLHLSPIDLDLLSEAACTLAGVEPVCLTDALVRSVGGNGDECSADVVSPDWVEMMASFSKDQVEPLAASWAEKMAEEHPGEVIEPTPEVLQVIIKLIVVCQTALRQKVAVVHTWSM